MGLCFPLPDLSFEGMKRRAQPWLRYSLQIDFPLIMDLA